MLAREVLLSYRQAQPCLQLLRPSCQRRAPSTTLLEKHQADLIIVLWCAFFQNDIWEANLSQFWSSSKKLYNVSNHVYGLSGPVRDTPPYRAIPFRDSIADPFALFSSGIAPVSLRYPFGGGIAPPLRMLSIGETLRKGVGGIAPNCP